MKVFLFHPDREDGPFTPAQINRMFAKGQVDRDQLCRIDGRAGTRPLKEQFRHMAPPDEKMVKETRARVRAWNLQEGEKMITLGGALLAIGFYRLAAFASPRALIAFLAGAICLWTGFAQKRRANAARKAELRAEQV